MESTNAQVEMLRIISDFLYLSPFELPFYNGILIELNACLIINGDCLLNRSA